LQYPSNWRTIREDTAMAYAKRTIRLNNAQRDYLQGFITKGVRPVQAVKRARILLECDTSGGRRPDKESAIAEKVGVSVPTVKSVKRTFHDLGKDVEAVVKRKERDKGPRETKITGDVEAHLIALCCSPAPEGYARWTVRLLAEKMVELDYIDEISAMSVSRTLKKTHLSLT
ncbi:MAG: helix-turn-helix domain-containing protein, partial [Sphaerochaeta sp.]|nr:helix-turn-helix domain-containing protein [Sphaerochaeta sp.]